MFEIAKTRIPSSCFGRLCCPSRAALAASMLALLAASGQALGDAWVDGFGLVGADGSVQAVASVPGGVVAGGDIDVIGQTAVGNIARWNGTTWQAMGNPLNGTVRAVLEHDGTIYAAGDFTKAGFTNVSKIARWDGQKWVAVGTGGIQGPAVGTRVNDVEFLGGNLYAAGNFTKAGGKNATDIAYWDGTSWYGMGATSNGAELHDIAAYGDSICVVGSFTKIDDVSTQGVACWNGSSWRALGSGLNGAAVAITVHAGDLYVGGSFTFAGGVSTGRLARWNGSEWSSVDYPLSLNVNALGTRGTKLVVATAGGSATNPAKPWLIEWDGVTWSNAVLQPDAIVHAIVPGEAGVLVGGEFARAAQMVLGGVGYWTGLSWIPLEEGDELGLHGIAETFAVWNGDLYVAGNFRAAGNEPASLVARWNPLAGEWSVVGNTTSSGTNSIDALVAGPDGLYAGGKFATIGGVAATNVARWNGLSWSAVGAGIDNRVSALAVLGEDVYAGGTFLNVNADLEETQPAAHVARWNGVTWEPLGDGTDGNVLALAVFEGSLVAAGELASAGGLATPGIARWNGVSWAGFGAGLTGDVQALHVHEGDLLAGGAITASGATPLSALARWTGSAWVDVAGGVSDSLGQASVNAMVSFGPSLFVGGSFELAGGVEARQIARLVDGSWQPLLPGFRDPAAAGAEEVRALAVHDGSLWLGGRFVRLADDRPAARVAVWSGCAVGNDDACAASTTTTTSTTTSTAPVSVCGDANGNGDVTATDAQFALRAAVGSEECALSVCDVNGNGSVASSDALRILQHAVGQPVELECPAP